MDNNNNNNKNMNNYINNYYNNNTVATVLKIFALIGALFGGYALLVGGGEWAIYVFAAAFSTFVLAEIIQILHDIKTNTEYIRDSLEKNK